MNSPFNGDIPNFGSAERSETINRIAALAAIGAKWRKDSSLETWFPLTAEELKTLKARHAELYGLVEDYLTSCSPEGIEDAYAALCAWFVHNKRPDGSEPRPIAKQQF